MDICSVALEVNDENEAATLGPSRLESNRGYSKFVSVQRNRLKTRPVSVFNT